MGDKFQLLTLGPIYFQPQLYSNKALFTKADSRWSAGLWVREWGKLPCPAGHCLGRLADTLQLIYNLLFFSCQFSSLTQACLTLCDPMDCSAPGFPVHHQLPELTQTHVHWVSDAIQPSILCRPLLLPPSIFPSIRVFSNESALCIRQPKYWSFIFNISLSNEYSGLISKGNGLRMDWLDLLAVQGTLKSLLQHHSSKASILQCSAVFIVQLSHPYMTTGKTIALTRRTFVGKIMSLLFNMLSRLVITFLPRSKCLLFHGRSHHLQWFWSPQKWSLSLFPLFPHLFATKWWGQMAW